MIYYPHNHPYFQDDHPIVLDEMNYKDIMKHIDPRNLPHRDYAPLIKYVKYIGTEGDIMKFYVPSPTKINSWHTYIQFDEWDAEIRDTSISAVEAARLLLWGANIRVHCDCPAYKFWGMQYIDTQLDIAINPEERFPHIRNPNLKGIVCKHLSRNIKVLPFHLGDMAKAIKYQRAHF